MKKFEAFKEAIRRDFFGHPVVTANPYTAWFKGGDATEEQVADLILQFSVFSNHFLVMQVKRMVNADTLEGERCARNILMNECGVGLNPATGEVEGRTFAAANAHLNWLREIGAELGLEAMELGRWEKATPATRAFLNGLDRTYGSRDGQTGAGASFAIETWAAFGIGQEPEIEATNFWKELIVGLEGHNRLQRVPLGLAPLPLGFFQYHFEIESGHGANVWRELEETFHRPDFDARRFLRGGLRALDAIHTFWKGLNDSRKSVAVRDAGVFSGINVAQWAF